MLLIVTLAATKILPIAIAAVAGVVLMIFTGCMTLRDALRALDPSMIFFTVASLALSIALMKTGERSTSHKLSSPPARECLRCGS